jgi:hypothetical protein
MNELDSFYGIEKKMSIKIGKALLAKWRTPGTGNHPVPLSGSA